MPLWTPSEKLGSTELTAAAAVTNTVIIPVVKYLLIYVYVSGYASNGIFSLQFGSAGTVDTATNYRDLNIPSAITGSATPWGTSVLGTAQTMIRLADAGITTGRTSIINVFNPLGTMHTAQWQTVNEGNSAAGQKFIAGNGNWQTAANAQLNCLRLTTSGGNLNAGTGFVVCGYNA